MVSRDCPGTSRVSLLQRYKLTTRVFLGRFYHTKRFAQKSTKHNVWYLPKLRNWYSFLLGSFFAFFSIFCVQTAQFPIMMGTSLQGEEFQPEDDEEYETVTDEDESDPGQPQLRCFLPVSRWRSVVTTGSVLGRVGGTAAPRGAAQQPRGGALWEQGAGAAASSGHERSRAPGGQLQCLGFPAGDGRPGHGSVRQTAGTEFPEKYSGVTLYSKAKKHILLLM